MSARNTSLALPLLGLALFAASGACLELGRRAQAGLNSLPSAFLRPLPPALSRISLLGALSSQRRAAADWAYIDALTYLGGDNKGDYSFAKSRGQYLEVLWLDPFFHFAVLEGAAHLAWGVGRPAEAKELLEEAMRVDPVFDRYRLYYAALAYKRDDQADAMLKTLESEILRPEAPEMLLRIVGNIYMKHKNWESAEAYWRWVLGRAKEPLTLRQAEAGLARARRERAGR
jgi:tetratricopeptide (TPR) repeat protein